MTRVSVFGLGYVGAVTAACLADAGHDVVGVDVSQLKVDLINAGRSPIVEAGIEELIAAQVAAGRLRATSDGGEAVAASEMSLVCVGTPSNANGSLDLRYVRRVCRDIGEAIAASGGYHVVVARSTMLPGSTEEIVIPALEEASGMRAGDGLGVCYLPEFLREGTSIADFHRPPFTVVGGADERASSIVADLFAEVEAPLFVVPFRVAEMLKYTSNAFHALKVVFANEIGVLCKAQGIDSHQVMDLFCRDEKLNVSRAYLRPGYALGGSCLPKDLRALLYQGRRLDVHPPVLEAILASNRRHVELAYEAVRATGSKRVAVLGFSFKAGTDDLRESPIVELIERLIGKGFQVAVYDRNVSLATLHGSNRAYIEHEIPHVASIMVDSLETALAGAEVVVVGNDDPEFATVAGRLRDDQRVVDLVHITGGAELDGRYEGIAW